MVCLHGRPLEVGNIFGSLLSRHVIHRVNEFHEQLARLCPGRINEKRVDEFYDLLEREAPHWIEEYEALAHAAGVEFRTLLTLNCAVPLTAIPSCTSALVLGGSSCRGLPLLLKVRDERFQHQAMGYRRIRGTNGILFSTDVCNMGIGQGCNECGLAVANNSGGLVPAKPYPTGFNDCHITRLLLERAGNVDEALEVFLHLQKQGKVGLVDGTRGMIFLLADSRGKGLILEASPDQAEFQRAEEGLFVWSNHWQLPGSGRFTPSVDPNNPLYKSSVLRYERGRELLKDKPVVHIEDLKLFSRDEKNRPDSICNGSDAYPWRTVSVFIYELDTALSHPVHAAAGNPNRTPFQELPIWAEETPESYLLDWRG
ncbi:MAG: C45 family peptidase [Planctomycetota bacterium]